MTLEEKTTQLRFASPAIERLGVPEYNWWSECLHGVARAGRATVFPQAIAFGATFNPDLVFRVAEAIAAEARAKHHHSARALRCGALRLVPRRRGRKRRFAIYAFAKEVEETETGAERRKLTRDVDKKELFRRMDEALARARDRDVPDWDRADGAQ